MSHAALVQEEGIASLYKGIRPTLLGIMPYASWQEADVTDAACAAANLWVWKRYFADYLVYLC